MFTHPALLRELNQIADLLRRSGEGQWAQRVVQASDGLRKTGWTAPGLALVRDLEKGEPGLHQISFGTEHLRQLGSLAGLALANERLERHRLRLKELMELPTREVQTGPRPKSPDLAG
ncbi:MAG TPA: hypothetical protein VK914_00425 [bacterium]|jgi:hypothetical protein|nr:hypothetical protein [bacterium]